MCGQHRSLEVLEATSIHVRIVQRLGVSRTAVREAAMSRHGAHGAPYVRPFQCVAAGTRCVRLPLRPVCPSSSPRQTRLVLSLLRHGIAFREAHLTSDP